MIQGQEQVHKLNCPKTSDKCSELAPKIGRTNYSENYNTGIEDYALHLMQNRL